MLTFSGKTAEDKEAARSLVDQFRETFSKCDSGASKTGLLGAGEFRRFVQQSQASLKERNLEIPMPNKEQLNELCNSM